MTGGRRASRAGSTWPGWYGFVWLALLGVATALPGCQSVIQQQQDGQRGVTIATAAWRPEAGGVVLPSYDQALENISQELLSAEQQAAGALLRNGGTGSYRYLCSGVLIAQDLFLTAAHCFVRIREFTANKKLKNWQRIARGYASFERKDAEFYRQWTVYLPAAGLFEVEKAYLFCFDATTEKPCLRHDVEQLQYAPVILSNRSKRDERGHNHADLAIVKLKSRVAWIEPAKLGSDPCGLQTRYLSCPLLDRDGDGKLNKDEWQTCHQRHDQQEWCGNKDAVFIGFGKTPTHHPDNAGVQRLKQVRIDKVVANFIGPLLNEDEVCERRCLSLPILKLAPAARTADEICRGDSGGPLFFAKQVVAIASVRRPKEEHLGFNKPPYDDSRCLDFDPEHTYLIYVGQGLARDWIDHVLEETQTISQPLQPARTKRIKGKFLPQNRFRMAHDLEVAHTYFIKPRQDGLCRESDRHHVLTVALNGELGSGYSIIQSGNYRPNDFNLYVVNTTATRGIGDKQILGKPYITPDADAEPAFNTPEMRYENRFSCMDASVGPFASCKVVEQDSVCDATFLVTVERVNGHGDYEILSTTHN